MLTNFKMKVRKVSYRPTTSIDDNKTEEKLLG